MTDALTEAINVAGSQKALADAIGVRSPSITEWRMRGVPLERCPDIEGATGVRCEALRTDVAWTRDKAGQVTGYHVPLAGAA